MDGLQALDEAARLALKAKLAAKDRTHRKHAHRRGKEAMDLVAKEKDARKRKLLKKKLAREKRMRYKAPKPKKRDDAAPDHRKKKRR